MLITICLRSPFVLFVLLPSNSHSPTNYYPTKSPLPAMPQEITDMIIDCLAEGASSFSGNKRALATCALVCRSWVPRSRTHLFRHIVLDSSIGTFAPLLRSDKCTFAPYVRDISAFRTFGDPSDHHFDKIGKDLKRLTNVTTLRLDGIFHACAAWDGFMCGFKNVTELSVHFHLIGHSNCVLGLIHMLPSLQRLHVMALSPVIFWTEKPPSPTILIPPQDLTPPPRLHSLRIGEESARHLLSWLTWYNRLSQIDTLDLSPFPTTDVPQMKNLLPRMSSNIHHLHLHSEVVLSTQDFRYGNYSLSIQITSAN
jgi:hypothetical protein